MRDPGCAGNRSGNASRYSPGASPVAGNVKVVAPRSPLRFTIVYRPPGALASVVNSAGGWIFKTPADAGSARSKRTYLRRNFTDSPAFFPEPAVAHKKNN